uniref:Glyco_trans_4-like_N domain-containing protein n=2 Tax=Macrostomum lignano TaxID=282301 RepID=A0A1I8GV46_9PLAT
VATTVQLLVLGDAGRSPRMQLHALSFAESGYHVTLLGYSGSPCRSAVANHRLIKVEHIRQAPAWLDRLPTVLAQPLKLLALLVLLCCSLLARPRSDLLLVQSPPAVPALLVAWAICRLGRRRLIVDWHNYGWTLARAGRSIYRSLELGFASRFLRSDTHLCVTEAMRRDLRKSWGIDAVAFHDRPSPDFAVRASDNPDATAAHRLFDRLGAPGGPVPQLAETPLTRLGVDGVARYLPIGERPALLVSSTSWTLDEDFAPLMEALDRYDSKAESDQSLPDLLCVVTGRGPMRDYYLSRAGPWRSVRLVSAWLEPADYPALLAAADLGVSLHASSSGLDLPMKVVDMFGCGLPVCALRFPAIGELVRHGVNGLLFDSGEQLAEQLAKLLRPAEASSVDELKRLRRGARDAFRGDNFVKAWRRIVRPVVRALR